MSDFFQFALNKPTWVRFAALHIRCFGDTVLTLEERTDIYKCNLDPVYMSAGKTYVTETMNLIMIYIKH